MTNYEVLQKLGLQLNKTAVAKLFEGANIICYHQLEEGNRCAIHEGMCDQCVPAWLDENATMAMLQFLDTDLPELTPGKPDECLGNGKHPDYECCCDNCDYYLECFPEWAPGGTAWRAEEQKD